MAITFDPINRRIILDTTNISASEIWIEWINWVAASDNSKYLPALKQVGGEELGGGLFIPPYIFLLNNWRVRPMESNHTLVITGNLFVEGGGVPVVPTLGNFNVSVQYTLPVQAQAIATGGTSGPSASQVADAVWNRPSDGSFTTEQLLQLAAAVLVGKTNITDLGNGTAIVKFRDLSDTKDKVVAEMINSSRTNVTI